MYGLRVEATNVGENTGDMKGWGSLEEKTNSVRSRKRGRKVPMGGGGLLLLLPPPEVGSDHRIRI